MVESDARRGYLLEFIETLRHECENKSLTRHSNFVWASKSGMVYQLFTSHETLTQKKNKKTCHSLKYSNLCKGILKTKCYPKSLAILIEVGHFISML